jgi:hypothetical protein
MRRLPILSAIFLTAIVLNTWTMAEETRLEVKHDHLFTSCKGQLIFNDNGVRYETKDSKHARDWKYEDIQQLGIEPNKVVVLTYRDRLLYLGKDEKFTFEVTEGQVKDSLRAFVEEKLTRPLVSAVLPSEVVVRYRIPVKHRRALRGTEGVLELSDRYLIYRTTNDQSKGKSDARIWRYDELVSVGSTGPFQLRVTAMERTGGEYGGGKNFVFDLKEKLPEQAYDYLWDKINRPRIDGVSSSDKRASSDKGVTTVEGER